MSKKIVALLVLLSALIAAGCNQPSHTSTSNDASAPQTAAQPQPEAIPAPQASPDPNVATIIQFISDKNNAKKFASYKTYEEGAIQVAFNSGGKRYTIYYPGEMKGAWLSYWVRPKASLDQTSLDTFSATMTGLVKFGMTGKGKVADRDKTTEENKKFADQPDIKFTTGFEHRQYWQQRFDEAISATLKYIGKPELLTSRSI